MTHEEAMSRRPEPDRHDPDPACAGELVFEKRAMWDDVVWSTYVCQRCGARIHTAGGRPHHWNHIGQPASR